MKPNKYHGLDMHSLTNIILQSDPELWEKTCNGVGSTVGTWWQRWLYHVTPNTIWGLDITPASDIHDVEYTYPDTFSSRNCAETWREAADWRFLSNCYRLIERGWPWLRPVRRARALAYYHILRAQGERSFMASKTIGE